MSYKTVAVHLMTESQNDRNLAIAVQLARKFGSHINALHADFLAPDSSLYAYSVPVDFVSDLVLLAQTQRRASEASFKALLQSEKISGDWVLVDDYPPVGVAERSRASDLLILHQYNWTSKLTHSEMHFAESMMLSAGVPVLLVPDVDGIHSVGENILVAWNGSRESSRAVHDALPFLKRAKRVTVIMVVTPASTVVHDYCSGEEVIAALARHGVTAVLERVDNSKSHQVADVLRSRIADLGADLLVMGGYGHSRAYETLLGGVTRSIVAFTSVPVLLSH